MLPTFYADDADSTIDHDHFIVVLKEIPSSGYGWQVSDAPAGVELIADSRDPHTSEAKMLALGASADDLPGAQIMKDNKEGYIGGRYNRVMIFRTNGNVGKLRLIKTQSWMPDPEAAAVEEFELSIAE